MLLDRFTNNHSQILPTSDLYRLTALSASSSIADQFQLFLLSCRANNLSPRTIGDYRFKGGRFIRFCASVDCQKAVALTSHHVRAFLLQLQEHNKPKSVQGYFKVARRFLEWLVEEELLEKNPAERVKAPRVPENLIKPFNPSHIANIMLLCDRFTRTGIRNRAIILTLLDTGLRLSELANVKLSDVDMDHETITVMGKGSRQRIVRIGRNAQKALLEYLLKRRDNLPCLWVSEEGNRPLQADGIALMFRQLKRRAGFTDVRLSAHTFRHTSGTWALLNGASEREVQLLLGHRTNRMTQHYTATITSQDVIGHHQAFSPVDNFLKARKV